ncbi:MAG: hypothetical protein ACYS8K_10060, partial [Planctomycetota bacterium]
ANLLKLAPQNTLGVGVLNVKSLLASPLYQQAKSTAQQQMPGQQQSPTEKANMIVAFLFPSAEGSGKPVSAAGVATFDAPIQAELEPILAQQAEQVTIEGMVAYKKPGSGVVALADEKTMLFGSDESAVALMARSYKAGGGAELSAEVRQMLAPFAGDTAYGGLVLTDELRALAAAEEEGGDVPPYMQQAVGGAFGLKVSDQMELKGLLRLAGPEGAQQAQAELEAKLAEAKQQMQQEAQDDPMAAAMLGPLMGIMDSVQAGSEDADLRVSLTVTQEQFQGLMQAAFGLMMRAMMSGQGGPAMGPGMPMGPPSGPGPGQ